MYVSTVHVCPFVWMYGGGYVCNYASISLRMYVDMLYKCLHVCICMCMYVCMYGCKDVRMSIPEIIAVEQL